ncbi:MAG: Fe-S cluster assembly protein SufD [Myxococcota bacterium]
MSSGAAEAALRRALAAPRDVGEPAWLQRLRAGARDAFLASGLPTTRHEDWRYTPLARLEALDLEPREASCEQRAGTQEGRGEHRLVFANGRLQPELSDVGEIRGCRVESLAEALVRHPEQVAEALGRCGDPKRRPFEALNTALFRDGAFISLAPGAVLDRPIRLRYESLSGPAHVRSVVDAGADSRAVVLEEHVGRSASPSFVNAVTELSLARGAQVDYVLVQRLPESSVGFTAVLSRQEAASRLALHSIALGGALARVELEARLEGERAELGMNGLYLGRGAQLQDQHTTIDHAAPCTSSRELFKGILDGRAHGVFHGRIHVRPDSQKIDASQTNRALLLSDGAVIDSKPQLEIYADDVKCSHGASVGQLDPDQIFYLRARGLDLERARALLTFGFASEVLAKLPLAHLRESLEREVLAWLPLGGAP